MLGPRAVKKSGKWCRGVVEAADCYMMRWHRGEAMRSWLRHPAQDAKGDEKGRGRGSRTDTAVDERRDETIDRVARYRSDEPLNSSSFLFVSC